MSWNSPNLVALHSRQLPILGRLQSIYTLHNKLQSIYLLPSIIDINYNQSLQSTVMVSAHTWKVNHVKVSF
jgi:hypothetical protein